MDGRARLVTRVALAFPVRLAIWFVVWVDLAFLKRRINGLLPNIFAYVVGFNHYLCDAAVVAYTAFCTGRVKQSWW